MGVQGAIFQKSPLVAEGVKTTQAVHALAQQLGVEMPIADQVYAVLYEAKDPEAVATELMTRQLRDEREIDGR